MTYLITVLCMSSSGFYSTTLCKNTKILVKHKLSKNARNLLLLIAYVLVAQLHKYNNLETLERVIFCKFKHARKKRIYPKNALSSILNGLDSGA